MGRSGPLRRSSPILNNVAWCVALLNAVSVYTAFLLLPWQEPELSDTPCAVLSWVDANLTHHQEAVVPLRLWSFPQMTPFGIYLGVGVCTGVLCAFTLCLRNMSLAPSDAPSVMANLSNLVALALAVLGALLFAWSLSTPVFNLTPTPATDLGPAPLPTLTFIHSTPPRLGTCHYSEEVDVVRLPIHESCVLKPPKTLQCEVNIDVSGCGVAIAEPPPKMPWMLAFLSGATMTLPAMVFVCGRPSSKIRAGGILGAWIMLLCAAFILVS